MNGRQTIRNLNLGTIMNERFSRYAKSIIQQRAIPDDRDGLKPVQRRILYAMWKDGNTVDKAYRKSAKAVGNVMGNFHPHGDSSIYEALINMSQSWKMRLPLIDLHGNNGSIDDDPPAAMRYTEARLSKASNEMMRDIKKNTVSWVLNFDDTEYEPTVLPSRFPNLIVNGAKGISSGYATEIPPHNLGEVINAVIYLQLHPQATLDELMHFIKGPDFPTGGIVQGIDGLRKAYRTGRGKVVVRARDRITKLRGGKHEINVTEIPYGLNKKHLVHEITRIALEHRINGINEVRDDSDRHGLSIVIILKRHADAQSVLDYLYKHTDLQIFYHFNVVAIDHMQPKLLSLKSLLVSYLDFQRKLIYDRTKYDLKRVQRKQEIVQGYLQALSSIDVIIKLIRQSSSRVEASQKLVQQLRFTPRQADAIVALRLYRLTNTNGQALRAENNLLSSKIAFGQKVVNSNVMLDAVLRKELLQIKNKYTTPRRTTVEKHVRHLHISKRVTIPNEDVIVMVSHDGYLKRSSLRSYSSSQKHGNGLRPGDYPLFVKHMNTRDHLILFTNQGRIIYRPVNDLKEVRWKDTGTNLSQSIQMKPHEQIINVYGIKDLKQPLQFLMVTNNGYAKRTNLRDMLPGRTYRHHAPSYMRLKANARVIQVLPMVFDRTMSLITKRGYAVRFKPTQISVSGTNALGMHAMHLHANDQVIGMRLTHDDSRILAINQSGRAYLFKADVIPVTARNRVGKQIIAQRSPLVSFIVIDSAHLEKPVRIFTKYRRQQNVIPNELGLIPVSSHGRQVVKVSQLGVPVRLLY